MTSSPPPDAEFTRKLALGILSVLHQKGLLTSEEVDAILYTARHAALESQPPAPRGSLSDPQPAAGAGYKAIRRAPLSDPQPVRQAIPRPTAPLSDPTPKPPQEAPLVLDDQAQQQASEELTPEAAAARLAEARWVRKEKDPPPTFDIEL